MKIKNLVLTTLLSLGRLTSCANNDKGINKARRKSK